MMDTIVREIEPQQEHQWRKLWAEYLDFYEIALPAAVTRRTWRRLLDPSSSIIGLTATRQQELVGFAIVVLHESTWSLNPTAYLEDLFVQHDQRQTGVGRALIDHLLDSARRAGWETVYWHTRADNFRARRLYDRYALADGFVRYRLFMHHDQKRPGPVDTINPQNWT